MFNTRAFSCAANIETVFRFLPNLSKHIAIDRSQGLDYPGLQYPMICFYQIVFSSKNHFKQIREG